MARHGVEDGLMAALLHLLVESQHNRLLGSEVVISSAQGDSGRLRDVAHGGGFKAFFPEQFHGGFVDAPARVPGARLATRFDTRLRSLRHRKYSVIRGSGPGPVEHGSSVTWRSCSAISGLLEAIQRDIARRFRESDAKAWRAKGSRSGCDSRLAQPRYSRSA